MIEAAIFGLVVGVVVLSGVWFMQHMIRENSRENLRFFLELEDKREAARERKEQRYFDQQEEQAKQIQELERQVDDADKEFVESEEAVLPLDPDMEANQWRS